MSMDTRSPKSRLLVAGAAGLMIGMPLSLRTGSSGHRLNAAEPAPRHAQSMLQLIVDRESRTMSANAWGSQGEVITVAGETQTVEVSPNSGPEFQQQYGSEVQRQLQKLYQQDGRTMPQMQFTPVPHDAMQHYPPAPKKMRLKDVFNPSAWKQRFSRPEPQQPPAAPDLDASPATHGATAPAPQAFTPPPAPAVTETPQRPQLQRYSPEIFDAQELAEPVPAPAATEIAEQPGLFPGAAPVAAPVATSEAPTKTPPLLIILPESPSADVAAEPTPPAFAESQTDPVTPAQPGAERAATLSSLPRLETSQRQSPSTPAADVANEAPPLLLAAPEDDAVANPFPEQAEVEAEAAGPYTGLGLDESPYETPEFASPALPPLPGQEGAFAAPAQPAEPEASQLAAPSPLKPAANSGPVLIAPGTPPTAELPLVQPARPTPPREQQLATSSSASKSEKYDRIAAREGLTGFKGFCPVMLRDYRELVDASREHSVIYQGRQFWFSSDAAKQAFLGNPALYMPAGGGIDPVVYHQSGQSVEGSLDNAVWYHGQLYLFSSQVTKAEFVASPRAHAFE